MEDDGIRYNNIPVDHRRTLPSSTKMLAGRCMVDVVCQKRYAAEKIVWIPTQVCYVGTWLGRMNLL